MKQKKSKALCFLALLLCCMLTLSACAGAKTTEASSLAASSADSEAGSASDTQAEEITEADFVVEGFSEKTATADNKITFSGSRAAVSGSGATVSGGVVTITKGGVYLISGTADAGQLVVNAPKEQVQLLLSNVTLHCKTGPAIYVIKAQDVICTAVAGTKNTLSDGSSYQLETEPDGPVAALFSHGDLLLNGTGALSITGNCANGIVGKDSLRICSTTLTVTAKNAGIKGKDSLKILSAKLNITAEADGLKATDATDQTVGFVWISKTEAKITAGTDGIQAESTLTVTDSTMQLVTGGGSGNGVHQNTAQGGWGPAGGFETTEETSDSAKGLKAKGTMTLSGNQITVNAADDAIHGNGDVLVKSGSYTIASGDDGVHADSTLTVSGGTISISQSYEGLEGKAIKISGGTVQLVASDDGLNAAGGSDSSGQNRPGQNTFAAEGDVIIEITGGSVYIDSDGDGVDSNGTLTVSGGTVLVNGPTSGGDAAMDANGEMTINGGFVLAVGSSGMLEGFSSTSKVNTLTAAFSTQSAGTLLRIEDEQGNLIAAFTPKKSYSAIQFAASSLKTGTTYLLVAGGSTAETAKNGLVTGGTATGGSTLERFTVSQTNTTLGSAGQGGMTGGFGRG